MKKDSIDINKKNKLISLLEQGFTLVEIARVLDVTYENVRKSIYRYNITIKPTRVFTNKDYDDLLNHLDITDLVKIHLATGLSYAHLIDRKIKLDSEKYRKEECANWLQENLNKDN